MARFRFIVTTFSITTLLLVHAVIVSAQATQTGSVTILPSQPIIEHEPDGFNFPPKFIPSTPQNISLYQTLDPSMPENILEVVDFVPDSGFLVTVSMDDFESPANDNYIHYTNFGFVTLSESLTDEVDSGPSNNPPGQGDTTAPQHCDWDSQSGTAFKDACDAFITPFSSYPTSSTTLAGDINPGDTVINVADGSQLVGSSWIIINGDVIGYTGMIGNQLTGVTGINTAHLTGDTVTRYYKTSQQVDLMSNSTIAQTGSYSVGFGFKLNYNQDTIPADYTSTITFTIMAI